MYYNENKKVHSVKVRFGYVFDWNIEDETRIFKTIEEFERWELRNPECEIHKVKVRYKKDKKKK